MLKGEIGQPTGVYQCPGPEPRITLPMAQQKGLQMLALLAQVLHRGFACAHQITYRFVPQIWHPDRRQLSSSVQSGQSDGISVIGLNVLARPLGNQGRCDNGTIMPESRNLAM
jgi:hypothetical protein